MQIYKTFAPISVHFTMYHVDESHHVQICRVKITCTFLV